jgi:hypothetical protein
MIFERYLKNKTPDNGCLFTLYYCSLKIVTFFLRFLTCFNSTQHYPKHNPDDIFKVAFLLFYGQATEVQDQTSELSGPQEEQVPSGDFIISLPDV